MGICGGVYLGHSSYHHIFLTLLRNHVKRKQALPEGNHRDGMMTDENVNQGEDASP
jgi:hypothetical protein